MSGHPFPSSYGVIPDQQPTSITPKLLSSITIVYAKSTFILHDADVNFLKISLDHWNPILTRLLLFTAIIKSIPIRRNSLVGPPICDRLL